MDTTGALYRQPATKPVAGTPDRTARGRAAARASPAGSRGPRGLGPADQPDPGARITGQLREDLESLAAPAGHPVAVLDQVRPPDGPRHRRRGLLRRLASLDGHGQPGFRQAHRGGQSRDARPDHQHLTRAFCHPPTVAPGPGQAGRRGRGLARRLSYRDGVIKASLDRPAWPPSARAASGQTAMPRQSTLVMHGAGRDRAGRCTGCERSGRGRCMAREPRCGHRQARDLRRRAASELAGPGAAHKLG